MFYWMKLKPHLLHHVTAVFHCHSPRGSACVQAAPGGKIQTEYMISSNLGTHCLASELISNSIFTPVKIIRWRQLPA